MSGFTKGGRDFLDLGTYNVMCAYCGRKRKASEMVIDDQFARGMLVCKIHQDLRHPQEFARGIKEDMTVPKVQPPIIAFTSLNLDFPLAIQPSSLVLAAVALAVLDELSFPVLDENGLQVQSETTFEGWATAVLPPWISLVFDPLGIYVVSVAWSWKSGGANIVIDDPSSLGTYFQSLTSGNSGVAQCVVTTSAGSVGVATVLVSD